MAALIRHWLKRGRRILVLVHRVELVDQILEHVHAGTIASGRPENRDLPVQVATVQTLLSRKKPNADILILDECHHYVAEEWSQVVAAYPSSRVLGFTATPTRSDGKPLGNLFQEMVVAAHYPELIQAGHLVRCKVIRPNDFRPNLAMSPVDAYLKYSPGEQAIAFCRLKDGAKDLAAEFQKRGISSQHITSETKPLDRARIIQDFKDKKFTVLTNVFCLTEGFDSTCPVLILCRGVGHVSSYLQMCGRVLRPGPGKERAIIIDLPGVSHVHGMPTQRRHYSLEKGIFDPDSEKPVRVKDCPACGNCMHPALAICDKCGYSFSSDSITRPEIFSRALSEVWDGSRTPWEAKARELTRLRRACQAGGYNPSWIVRRYRELFGETPELSREEKIKSFRIYQRDARRRGQKIGSAYHKFRGVFKENPPRC